MRHPLVVDDGRVKGSGERELTEHRPGVAVNRRDTARDVTAIDEQHQHVVDAVLVQPLGCRPPHFRRPRLDAELVHLHVPRRHVWRQCAERRAAALQDRGEYRARANTRFFAVPLFDGTSADGVQDSTTAIAAWTQPTPNPAWPDLSPLPSVSVRIAFFAREGTKQQPEYEVGMRYWENGIADQLTMDFGDYVLSGKLTELILPKPGC